MVRFQGSLFDIDTGEALKRDGIERAVENRADLLQLAQDIAHMLGKRHLLVNADQVQNELIRLGYDPVDLGNAAGAIFRGPHWEFTGKWCRSHRISNHARAIRIWRYIP